MFMPMVIKRTNKASEIQESRSRPLLARYYMQKETKPLSHVTAAFGSVLYSERNEAVKSWDNGRFLAQYHIPNETKPLSYGIKAAFGAVL